MLFGQKAVIWNWSEVTPWSFSGDIGSTYVFGPGRFEFVCSAFYLHLCSSFGGANPCFAFDGVR
jgi:hypothetical protein